MVIISPRADYETFRADYRNHSTKSARPLSIVKFVFLCDNDDFPLATHSDPEGEMEKVSHLMDSLLWPSSPPRQARISGNPFH